MTENVTAEAIRCSDAEREQVRRALYAAAGEGRLTMDEVEERLGQLETARFRHELSAMTTDLPSVQEQSPLAGWRAILAAAGRAFAADIAVLRGRAPEPSPGRRRLLIIVAALLGLLIAAALVIGVVHGFADGSEPHGAHGFDHD
ncbi:DUF1707 SHOCT-like domain-containing protein [Amycolatopsis vancoresmycina]|uniref:DUF1707 domain-containing protein n=1 Tax=Amycolatopsis vancoresmycina DSM 44592 TaxID=1292037 RepID=R1HKD7_9PSEU|nr:DUF1707 domain-containing protein [Amycolatopsis vancoresmycina]EOD64000.1 hypothetical protein H480_34050 [Amycolatopsis vancoresmycina DSM 44592]